MLINMNEMLTIATNHGFTVGAFNVTEVSNFRCVYEEAEAQKSPAIIAVATHEMKLALPEFYNYIRPMLMNSRNAYCLHLDHGHDMKDILAAIRAGFTSVMIDGAQLPFEENVRLTKSVVDIAHLLDVSVEGELGTIGIMNYSDEGGVDSITYTKPEEVVEFVDRTGVDSLAIAIGTAHGLYPKNYKPKLQLDLLREIKKVAKVPLVLHGGSGNPDDEIKQACQIGIRKVNIASDYKSVLSLEMNRIMNETGQFGFANIMPPAMEKARAVVKQKMELFGSINKQHLYYT